MPGTTVRPLRLEALDDRALPAGFTADATAASLAAPAYLSPSTSFETSDPSFTSEVAAIARPHPAATPVFLAPTSAGVPLPSPDEQPIVRVVDQLPVSDDAVVRTRTPAQQPPSLALLPEEDAPPESSGPVPQPVASTPEVSPAPTQLRIAEELPLNPVGPVSAIAGLIDELAVYVDPERWQETANRLIDGLNASLTDGAEANPTWIRVGYWAAAVATVGVAVELTRQALRTRPARHAWDRFPALVVRE